MARGGMIFFYDNAGNASKREVERERHSYRTRPGDENRRLLHGKGLLNLKRLESTFAFLLFVARRKAGGVASLVIDTTTIPGAEPQVRFETYAEGRDRL
jgi:hypothetical protein